MSINCFFKFVIYYFNKFKRDKKMNKIINKFLFAILLILIIPHSSVHAADFNIGATAW